MRLSGRGLKGLAVPLVNSTIFVVVTVLATGLLAASITSTSSGDRVAYYARFSDVAGLHPGQGVRIAGVRVGQVDKISVVDRRVALVRFSVDSDRALPASATAAIKYLNLVGGRYIALEQGTGTPGQRLPRGGTIPVERTTPPLNLTALFQGFQPLMQALSPADVNRLSESIVKVLQGEGGTLDSLLRTVGSLTSTLAGKDQVIGQLITNLTTVTETINTRDRQLVELVTTLRRLTSGLAADRVPIGQAVGAIGELTSSTASLLQVGREPLRRDIGELGRLAGNLDRDAPLVERFLRRLPDKMTAIGRINSYGSWVNFYQCEVRLIGVRYAGADVDHRPPPTGIPITDARCGG